MNQLLIPVVTPIMPVFPKVIPIYGLPTVNKQFVLALLIALATIGISILVGWVLTRVMRSKEMKCSMPVNLVLSGVVSLAIYLRFGLCMTMVQGILLGVVLLYASCSDCTDHKMDDCLWVMVVMLGLLSVPQLCIVSMLVGAVMVFLPQFLSALLCKQSLGGADIKLSTALAFLLGWQRGLLALVLGLLLAVVTMGIVQKIKKKSRKKPFALIPFLSVAAMVVFML